MGFMLLLLQSSGIKKLVPYLVVAGIVALIILISYMQGRSTAIAGEKQKQLNDWLNTRYREAKDRAFIEAYSSTVARGELRKRWAKK